MADLNGTSKLNKPPITGGNRNRSPVTNAKNPFLSKDTANVPEITKPAGININSGKWVEQCLNEFKRVMTEIVEKEEHPELISNLLQVAVEWRNTAEMLLSHEAQMLQTAGEVELKQQQLHMQNDLHQQSLSQNDTQHTQALDHANAKHSQGLKRSDATAKQKLTSTANAQQNKLTRQNTKSAEK